MTLDDLIPTKEKDDRSEFEQSVMSEIKLNQSLKVDMRGRSPSGKREGISVLENSMIKKSTMMDKEKI